MTLLKGRIERPQEVLRLEEGLSLRWIFDTSSAPKCPCLCSQPATKRKPPHAERKAKHLPPKYSVLFSSDHLRFEGAAETESVVSDPDPETIILIRGC